MSSACADVRIGGKTVAESFSDSRVAELTKAAMRGDADAVARMVKGGTLVNAEGRDHATPLIWAMYVNNLAGMEALLKAGADPNQKSLGGVSAFTWAAGGDKPKQFELLLRYGGNPNANDTGKIEDRPLSRAAAQGRLENVKLLVAAGADVNAHDERNENAAVLAISVTGNYEIAAYLLKQGFKNDLTKLARTAEIRQIPVDSDMRPWREEVIATLKERGVQFPAFVPCYPPGDPRRKEKNCKKSK